MRIFFSDLHHATQPHFPSENRDYPAETGPIQEPGADATQVDFNTLLNESDFVSLHTPLTDETRGLMNATAFAKMKPTAVLVNTSRGPVLDQAALHEALKSRRIFAAALDVNVPELLLTDSPLLSLENCIIVPHIASASWQTRQKRSRMAAENLIAGLKWDRLPKCVNEVVPIRERDSEVYKGRKLGIGDGSQV